MSRSLPVLCPESHHLQNMSAPYHHRTVKKAQMLYLTQGQSAAVAACFGLANYMDTIGCGPPAIRKKTNQSKASYVTSSIFGFGLWFVRANILVLICQQKIIKNIHGYFILYTISCNLLFIIIYIYFLIILTKQSDYAIHFSSRICL